MPSVSSIILAAALVRSTAAAGCYPAFVASGSYTAGAQVSAPTSIKTSAQVTCVSGTSGCSTTCTPGTSGCPAEGTQTVTTTTSVTHNYVCVSNANSAFCSQSSYTPVSYYSDQAWTKESTACTELPAIVGVLTPAVTVSGGCPKAFASGTDYDADDLVYVDTGYKTVYKCTSAPNNLFCGKTGYKPGEDQYWEQAWTALGVCSGDMAPTSSPVYTTLTDAGGCPGAYVSSTKYEKGDRVSKTGLVYQCKDWPMGAHCSQQGYEPGMSFGSGSQMTSFWKSAWTVIGHCKGSIAPTTAPQFNPATSVGGCPNKWVAGETYEEADRVRVIVSTLPIRQVVYQCKVWPFSGFCSQFEPTAFGGDQGWILAGNCDGSIGPTASPVFGAVAVSGDCPADWKASTTTYEAHDRVSLVVSTVPVRKIVYKCRIWPNAAYCNAGERFKPDSQYGSMAWTVLGSCDGSMAPTSAPIAYEGDCFYDKIVVTKNTGTAPCAHGSSSDCKCITCTGTSCPLSYNCSKPTHDTTIVQTQVTPWVSSYDYEEGEVIRAGNKRFKCKAWPFYFWCRMSAYQPTEDETGIFSSAWTRDGICHTREPTAIPSAVPSSMPSTSPMAISSAIPSAMPSTSSMPSSQPSSQPSTQPSRQPSLVPSSQPSTLPSSMPSMVPSSQPSTQPSRQPSLVPSSQPSTLPSLTPCVMVDGIMGGDDITHQWLTNSPENAQECGSYVYSQRNIIASTIGVLANINSAYFGEASGDCYGVAGVTSITADTTVGSHVCMFGGNTII